MSIGIIIILIAALLLLNKPQTPKNLLQTPTSIPQNEKVYPDSIGVDIKASFTVITNNITRSFKAEKYHNQSPDVFIESSNPTIVHVTKSGITWDDFFKTLPMKLTKDCLTTGDGENFCSGKGAILKFYINNIETPDLLNEEIRDRDEALINFAPR